MSKRSKDGPEKVSEEETVTIPKGLEGDKFWVLTSEPLWVFIDEDEAISKLQQALAEEKLLESGQSGIQLAELSWLKKDSKFEVNVVPQSRINKALAEQMTALMKELEELKKQRESESGEGAEND